MSNKKICVVGQGIRSTEQITLEALSALKSAKKILYLSLDSFQVKLFLQEWELTEAEDIKNLYEDSALDQANYLRLLEKIKNEIEVHSDVALLIPGHPRIGVTLVTWLENEKDKLNIDLKVLPGISSFDTMINDLALDPLEHGTQILDANRILLFNYQLEVSLDTFIYHVCSVGCSQTHLSDASLSNRLDLLQEALLNVYPSHHKLKLISSSIKSQGQAQIVECDLIDLKNNLNRIHFGTTLYVPSLKPRSIDRAFLKLLAPQLAS